MATTIGEVRATTGLTLTVDLIDPSDDSKIITGGACTEQTNAKGQYRFNHTGTEIGVYQAILLNAGTKDSDQWINFLKDDTNVYRGHDTYDDAVGMALYQGAIWLDSLNGASDASGREDDPVSTWTQAVARASALGYETIRVATGSAVTIDSGGNYTITGHNYNLAFSGSLAASKMAIVGANITGTVTFAGASLFEFHDCKGFVNLTLAGTGQAAFHNCSFTASMTITGGVLISFIDCESLPTLSAVTITSTATATHASRWSGDVTLDPTSGDFDWHCVSTSAITITGTSGNVNLAGILTYTDSSGGLVTIDDDAVINASILSGLVAGPGSRALTWTTKRGGLPLSTVEAWITTDAAGTNTVGGTYITDDSGIARVPGGTGLPMLDDDVVYYGWRDSPTHQFDTNPIQFRYSTADSEWQLWDGSAYNTWDGVNDDASVISAGSTQTSFVTTTGALIRVNKSRGITKDLTILKADGTTIVPQADDKIRVIIGREGRLGTNNADAELVVSSDAATSAGSSFTKGGGGGAKNRLRLDASDLTFPTGVYSMWFEMFDAEDTNEWKLVAKHVFVLEE